MSRVVFAGVQQQSERKALVDWLLESQEDFYAACMEMEKMVREAANGFTLQASLVSDLLGVTTLFLRLTHYKDRSSGVDLQTIGIDLHRAECRHNEIMKLLAQIPPTPDGYGRFSLDD